MAAVAITLKIQVERIHVLEYGLLGWICAWAADGSGWWPARWPLIIGIAFLIGLVDESIQAILPNRVGDIGDVLLNGISSGLGILLYLFKVREDKHAHYTHRAT